MAEQQDTNERTEQPTQRRKDESKKKGQVPRSRELNTMLSLLFAVLAIFVMGGPVASQFMALVTSALDFDRQMAFDKTALVTEFSRVSLTAMAIFAPFLAILVVGAIVGPLSMGGWAFSVSAMAFKVEKLNPLSGLKRVFSAKGLLELLKALFKFLILIAATMLLFRTRVSEIVSLGEVNVQQATSATVSLLTLGLLILSCTLIFIVVFDVPFELWNHNRQLKMTRQEVRDELKETEGRPEIKSRIRTLQREASQRRMMDAVPDADVVITNPTHFAVALKYDQSPSAAPLVVAKGRDLMALRIRSVAIENDVAVFEAPPLARALYASVDVGDEIPANLYLAVARVLAYIYQLDSEGFAEPPRDLVIPEDYHDVV